MLVIDKERASNEQSWRLLRIGQTPRALQWYGEEAKLVTAINRPKMVIFIYDK